MLIYHIALPEDWAAAQETGEWVLSTRGRAISDEGFLHASRESQVNDVGGAIYADRPDAIVVEIDAEALTEAGLEVRLEPGDPADPQSDQYPHVYGGAIPVALMREVSTLGDWLSRGEHRAARFRNEIYHGHEHRWSGNPNQALIAEIEKLADNGARPGTALDVGAGEGADAIWLANHGWQVTAVEPSTAGRERGQAAAAEAGADVTWIGKVLEESGLEGQKFDLVVAMYVSFLKDEGERPASFLTDLVAPGGHLLYVHHDDFDYPKAHGHRFDREDYVDHDVLRVAFAEGWEIVTDDVRSRHVDSGGGAHHHTDLVLLARRNN